MKNKRIELILSKTGYTTELEKCETKFYIEKLEQALNKIREYINRKQIYLSPIDATAIEICIGISQIIDEAVDDRND